MKSNVGVRVAATEPVVVDVDVEDEVLLLVVEVDAEEVAALNE